MAGVGCLFLILLLWPARPEANGAELRIAGQPQMSNGAMLLSIVLSNGTSRTLNIVDDGAGKPFVALEPGTGTNPTGVVFGVGLTALSNTLKLNLASGAALTNNLRLTNTPPRFRLFVEVRDLGAERRNAILELLRYLTKSRTLPFQNSVPIVRSPWIENASISNSTQNTPARPKETNGSSQ